MAEDEQPPDVLSSLPRTRPQRRSAKRDAPARKAASTNGTGAATAKKPTARKATATAKPRAAKPRAKAAPRAKSAPRAKAAAGSKATAKIPPAGFAAPRGTDERPMPPAVELVSTAIQAAGELAQIGLAVGGQALRSALGRRERS